MLRIKTKFYVKAIPSPDGSRCFILGGLHGPQLWNVSTGKEISTRLADFGVNYAEFSPDGKKLLVSCRDATVRLWDLKADRELLVLKGHIGPISSARFSPDGMQIITLANDVRLWNLETGREVLVLRDPKSSFRSAAVSPDGTRLVTVNNNGMLRIWYGGDNWASHAAIR